MAGHNYIVTIALFMHGINSFACTQYSGYRLVKARKYLVTVAYKFYYQSYLAIDILYMIFQNPKTE